MRAIPHDAAALPQTCPLKKLAPLVMSVLLAFSLLPIGAFAYASAAKDGAASGQPAISETTDAGSATLAPEEQGGADDQSGCAVQGGCEERASATRDAAGDEESSDAERAASDESAEYSADQGGNSDSTNASQVPDESSGLASQSGNADARQEADGIICASAAVYGIDASGADQTWAASESYELPEGSTAADLFVAMLEKTGLQASYDPDGTYGLSINTITSPVDSSFSPGWDADTGCYWQFFYNGKSSNLGESSVALQPGDTVVWYYSATGASLPASEPPLAESPSDNPDDTVFVMGWIVGVNAEGEDEAWVPLGFTSLPAGSTAADLTEFMIEATGITADISKGEGYWWLNSVTSPNDPQRTLSYDQTTEAFWQLFVNEELSTVGAADYVLQSGDSITWYYGADGTMPGSDSGEGDEGDEGDETVDGVVVDEDVARPTDWDAQWPGFATGVAPEGAITPTSPTTDAWHVQLKDQADYLTNVSDPIVVNGLVYVAAGSQLKALNASTGAEFSSAQLIAPINHVARMVYADGIIVVPLQGGRLQALTADTLTTVWCTDALPEIDNTGAQQSQSSLTVSDGYVYYGTAAASSDVYYNGYFICVRLSDGAVMWSNENYRSGFYWSGAVVSDGKAVVGDNEGTLYVYDASTGDVLSMLSLGSSVRSTVVEGSQPGTFLVVSDEGVLHRVRVDASGVAHEVASVQFGSSSTSTPVVVDGTVYVGGTSFESVPNAWGGTSLGGLLAVIDEATMTVEHAITTYDGGALLPADSKSAPLVSVQSAGTYVYFTCNAEPGGVYCYRVGDTEATLLFEPPEGYRNYSMSSVVCGADGTLYYVNDSGALFAISGDGVFVEPETTEEKPVGNRNNLQAQPALLSSASRFLASSSLDESSEGADDLLVSAASSEAAEELVGETSASAENGQFGVPSWLPIAGIVVGACGLVAVAVVAVRLARRG